jgi:hypothetical protein
MIPCDYQWIDEYSYPATAEAAIAEGGEGGFLILKGVGDGTLELFFGKDEWTALCKAVDDVEWDLHPELQEDPEEG